MMPRVVDEICHHICEAARERHVLIGSGVFGEHIARARDIIFKPTEVLCLKRKLKQAKENFIVRRITNLSLENHFMV